MIIWYIGLAVTDGGRIIHYRRDPKTGTLVEAVRS
jgi:hypothetical protein